MHEYRYSISLRVRHPSIDPVEITNILQLEPDRCWKSGTERRTPKGRKLEGFYDETYWSKGISGESALSSGQVSIEQFLETHITALAQHEHFFERMQEQGGSSELFVGLFGQRNFGYVLEPKLLGAMAETSLSIAFDVYPTP
ncbi:MAG: DUF4279 domain-containing protein [Halioglobus sp.]|nr:DUF4279 domain-containing protein [Halioglobus sp.]